MVRGQDKGRTSDFMGQLTSAAWARYAKSNKRNYQPAVFDRGRACEPRDRNDVGIFRSSQRSGSGVSGSNYFELAAGPIHGPEQLYNLPQGTD